MAVTSSSRAILIVYAAALALACIWVPWKLRQPSGASRPFKYGFLWSPPKRPGYPPVLIKEMELTAKRAQEWGEAAVKAAKNGDSKWAIRDMETAKIFSDEYEQESKGMQRWYDEYDRTTLEINWGGISLEIVALTALCGVALLAVGRRAFAILGVKQRSPDRR
jgi:hypothetical protein